MAAPKGNQNGTKIKNPNLRQLAYDQYCDHLAKGKSKKSWHFEHPELTCCWKTMEKYIKDEIEFPPIKKEIAEAKGFYHWENVVEEAAIGTNEKANVAALQMLMRNKYGWDKPQERTEIDESKSEELLNSWIKQVSDYQSDLLDKNCSEVDEDEAE